MKTEKYSFVLVFLLLFFTNCQEDEGLGTSPVAKNNRTFAIDINEGATISYDNAIQEVKGMGIDEVKLSWDWDLMETQEGFDFSIPEIANIYYPAQNIPVSLIFRPANTNLKSVPQDLLNVAFDDQEFINRFKAFLDAVKSRTPDLEVKAVYIGNEIDILLEGNDTMWNEFINFFAAASNHARMLWGDQVKIGTIGTLRRMNQATVKPYYERLHDLSDIVGVTYYPIDNGFNMNAPDVVASDFDLLVSNYGAKEIRFTECGYSSGSSINSSLEKQSEFIQEVFKAWDKDHTKITHIDFTWLHDISSDDLNTFQNVYQIYDDAFVTYLGTLGLKENNGQNKPAFETLKEELTIRGW